jgi:predicted MPP superfamily phosphohydrolase
LGRFLTLASLRSFPTFGSFSLMNRRRFLKYSLYASPFAVLGSMGYGHYLERHDIEVVASELNVGLGAPVTLAFLSDIHFDPLFEEDYLTRVIALTSELQPDYVLFGGDYVSHSAKRIVDLATILGKAQATQGVFAILGNHDHWLGEDTVTQALTDSGITVLCNQSIPIANHAGWYLTGLESHWGGKPNTRSIEKTPSTAKHIMLAHEPDTFDTLTDSRIALQLSGHTHGGQIRVPFGGAIQLPTLGKKYSAGLFEQAERKLYVTRGIGTVNKHFRVNCRPEITLLKLT